MGPQRVGHDSTIGGQWQNLSRYRNFSLYGHRTCSINFPSPHKVIYGYLHIFSDSNPNFCLSPSFCQNNSLTDELKQWETTNQCCALHRVIIFPKEIGILLLDKYGPILSLNVESMNSFTFHLQWIWRGFFLCNKYQVLLLQNLGQHDK